MAQKNSVLVLLSLLNTLLMISGISIVIWTTEYNICSACFCYAVEDFTMLYQTIFFSCGILLSVISLFGFIAMFLENQALLRCFGKMLIFLIVAIFIILWLGLWGAGPVYLRSVLQQSFRKYGTGNCRLDTSVDVLQTKFHCCGVDRPEDWMILRAQHIENVSLEPPFSCCNSKHIFKAEEDFKCISTYQSGCYTLIRRYLWRIVSAITAIAFGLALIMGLAIISLFQLTRLIKDERDRLQSEQNIVDNFGNALQSQNVPLNLYPNISALRMSGSSTAV